MVLTTSRGGIAQTTLEAKGLPAIEIQPLQVSKTSTGLNFGQVSLGHNDPVKDSLPYRLWIRSTTQADHNTTVTVTLPTGNPADFVWPTATGLSRNWESDDLLTPPIGGFPTGTLLSYPTYTSTDTFSSLAGTNPCNNRTVSLAIGADGNPTAATISANDSLGYVFDSNSGYWYCDFPVEFYPESAKGPLSAVLTGTGTGEGAAVTLTLTGNATGPLVITPSPALLANPVAVGLGSTTTLTLTITNEGSVTETGLSFALSGTGSGDFQIVGTDCWGLGSAAHAYSDLDQLLAGASCTVSGGIPADDPEPILRDFHGDRSKRQRTC